MQHLSQATGDEILLIQNETSGNEAAIRQAKASGLQVAFNMAPMNASRPGPAFGAHRLLYY